MDITGAIIVLYCCTVTAQQQKYNYIQLASSWFNVSLCIIMYVRLSICIFDVVVFL